jgi:hypothetical protein
MRAWTASSGSGQGPAAGFCDLRNELSGSIKDGHILLQLLK